MKSEIAESLSTTQGVLDLLGVTNPSPSARKLASEVADSVRCDRLPRQMTMHSDEGVQTASRLDRALAYGRR